MKMKPCANLNLMALNHIFSVSSSIPVKKYLKCLKYGFHRIILVCIKFDFKAKVMSIAKIINDL